MLDPGTRLGPYTIVELVAVGGMGEVYRAEDERLHRDVAIKVLPAHLSADRGSLDRFQREARAVASLSHPNILSIFDYGEENGVQYAVTEMLEGETLRTRLGRGRMTSREALNLMLEIAEGVAAAHARGIVHRDLKPENIFITSTGRVKVLDFGLARGGTGAFAARRATAPTEVLPTEPGVVLGTIGYLAPEQVEARTPTPATDVFALGCILFEMVGGRVPFEGASNAHAMVAVLHDDPPRLEDPRIDAIVQQCLQKSPHQRPQNAGELVELIHGVEREVPTERLPKRRLRTPYAKVALLVLLAIAIAAAAYFVQRHRTRLIDPSKPDDRRLMLVLADRASLGDVDAAERDLRASRLVRRPPIYHYTEGRIAWSRGDGLRAMQLYDRVAVEAAAESLAPLEIEARLLAGIAAIRLGRWDDALQRLATCDLRARQVGLEHRVFESAAYSAYAAHHSGDFEQRDRRLREAAAVKPPREQWLALNLLARRLGSDVWKSWSVAEAEGDPEAAATLLLIGAREAALAGNPERAKLLLKRARAEGIERAENREEAELLAAELGLPSTLLPADPPYPNMLRYLAIFDHAKVDSGA